MSSEVSGRAGLSGTDVKHDPDESMFFVEIGKKKAWVHYVKDHAGNYDFDHTFVPKDFRGQGLAGTLADVAFKHVASVGAKMRLSCSYLQHYHQQHPDKERDKRLLNDRVLANGPDT